MMGRGARSSGMGWKAAALSWRAAMLLPVMALSACGDRAGEQADDQTSVATNIVDEDLSGIRDVPQGENGADDVTENRAGGTDSAGPSGAGRVIPASLQGRWVGLDESCAARTTEMELTVTPSSLIFMESEGKVTGVSPGPDGRIRVDAAFTGEGQSWDKMLELRVAAGGRELTMIDEGRAVTRKRCR